MASSIMVSNRVATSSDVILTGGTGVLNNWVFDLVIAACERSIPPIETHLSSREHPVEDIGRVGGIRRILLAKYPHQPVIEAIAAGHAKVVAVLDDPVDMVRVSMMEHGGDLLAVLRDETRSAIVSHLLRNHPAALVVRRATQAPARAVASAVLDHLDIVLEPEVEDFVLTALAGSAPEKLNLEAALERRIPAYARLEHLPSRVSRDQMTTIRQVLSPMLLGLAGEDIGQIVWPRSVFLTGDAPDLVPPKVMDITGPARVLLFGPYFYLPHGTWRARLMIAISQDAVRTPFRLAVQCNLQPLVLVTFKPGSGGAFEGTFVFHHRASDQPVEINLVLQEGAIEGSLAVGQLAFDRMPVEPIDLPRPLG